MNSVECLATPVVTTSSTSHHHHEPYSNQNSRTVTGVPTTHQFHHHPGFPIGPGFPTPLTSLVPSVTDSSHHPYLVNRHPTAHNVS